MSGDVPEESGHAGAPGAMAPAWMQYTGAAGDANSLAKEGKFRGQPATHFNVKHAKHADAVKNLVQMRRFATPPTDKVKALLQAPSEAIAVALKGSFLRESTVSIFRWPVSFCLSVHHLSFRVINVL